jgi:ATP-dependent exoDNAse (exonuclease V) alpha subunit
MQNAPPGWVRTIHASQGATCDRVMAHLKAFHANTVNAASVDVAISRARTSAAVYTDSRASLTEALGLLDGVQIRAVDEALARRRLSVLLNYTSPNVAHL